MKQLIHKGNHHQPVHTLKIPKRIRKQIPRSQRLNPLQLKPAIRLLDVKVIPEPLKNMRNAQKEALVHFLNKLFVDFSKDRKGLVLAQKVLVEEDVLWGLVVLVADDILCYVLDDVESVVVVELGGEGVLAASEGGEDAQSADFELLEAAEAVFHGI